MLKGLKHGYSALPWAGQLPVTLRESLKILLLSQKINSLTRRVQHELERRKVNCLTVETCDENGMVNSVNDHQPDVIVCPYMVAKIPEQIYSNSERPCLIVHPGIAGDRGACSLDWAILNRERIWGVTVLQASEEMDAGNIWSTQNFELPDNSTKTSLYNGHVADAAVNCVLDAVSRFCQNVQPLPLNNHPDIRGTLRRNMRLSDRSVDWNASSWEAEARVRMSDTTPGAIGVINTSNKCTDYRLFDAHLETAEKSGHVRNLLNKAKPGELVAQKNKSVLVKAADEYGVWIGQMKQISKLPELKLPSTLQLKKSENLKIPHITEPCSHDDVKIIRDVSVCYVYFDFYNGAMDVEQANRLEAALKEVAKMPDVNVVVLTGGERFFSTGIHLCVIENSPNKRIEAWSNINAIDDVVKTLVTMTNKASVAVLRGNAGAGGQMLAAACDFSVAHKGVLCTPSYKAMNLYGSEYWTYFLPRRVGHEKAQKLVRESAPLSAYDAESIGLLDKVLDVDRKDTMLNVKEFLQEIQIDGKVDEVIRKKSIERDNKWRLLIQKHRDFELTQMRRDFGSSKFLNAMHNFVYHKNASD